jgi:hypothetical protein
MTAIYIFAIVFFGDGEPDRITSIYAYETFDECQAQIDAFDWSGREAAPICFEGTP